jgi:ketosteroid isomerase-like protein
MGEQDNVRIVRELLVAFQRGDLRALHDLCSEDVVIQHPIPKEILAFAGISRGKEEAKRFWAGMAERFDLDRFQPREFIAQGDNVAVIVLERSTNRVSGRAVDKEYMQVYTLVYGKVVRIRIYEDTAPILAAMPHPMFLEP